MKIDRNILKFWPDKEQRLQAAHLLDLCEKALEYPEVFVTPFLSPAQAAWYQGLLCQQGLHYLAWGGFEDAERVRYVFGTGLKKELQRTDARIILLHALPVRKDVSLEHRHILGSLLGLGLQKEVVGDIRKSDSGSVVAVADQIADYVVNNWLSVGRDKISVELFNYSERILPVQGIEKRLVTASARLDAVLAGSFGISRSAVQEYIRQGKVKRNDLIVQKPDLEVKVADILSCRGYGKLKILGEEPKTRKEKLAWRIFLYKNQK